MTTASLPRKTSRTEPAAAAPAAAPQHHGLFLEPHFAPGSRPVEDDEYEYEDGYEGGVLPAMEPARPARRR